MDSIKKKKICVSNGLCTLGTPTFWNRCVLLTNRQNYISPLLFHFYHFFFLLPKNRSDFKLLFLCVLERCTQFKFYHAEAESTDTLIFFSGGLNIVVLAAFQKLFLFLFSTHVFIFWFAFISGECFLRSGFPFREWILKPSTLC